MKSTPIYLPISKKTTLLYLLTHNRTITAFLKELTPLELIGIRDFLIDQGIGLSKRLSHIETSKEEVRKIMPPIQSYFMSQDCRETLYSCQNDTCFELEPQCFTKKLFAQIGALYEYIREQIGSVPNSENNIQKNELANTSNNGE